MRHGYEQLVSQDYAIIIRRLFIRRPSSEMRHSVTTVSYLLKKSIDNVLYALTLRKPVFLDSLVPVLTRMTYSSSAAGGWMPLYTMVTFRPDMSYATVKRKASRQNQLLVVSGWLGILLCWVFAVFLAQIMWDRVGRWVGNNYNGIST